MMNHRKSILLAGLLLGSLVTYGQDRRHYWKDSEALLQDQATLIVQQAYTVLQQNPPTTQPNDTRKLALFSLDALLHDNRLDQTPYFTQYIAKVGQQIIDGLRRPIGKNETRVFRFYNHGFIVQSAKATIAFDLVRGGKPGKHFFTETTMQEIASLCDVLFVSHIHSDHADKVVADQFLQAGKPVVTPTNVWKGTPKNHIEWRSDQVLEQSLALLNKASLKVKVFPGHQDNVPNNVYAVTLPNGKTFMHTGDQYNEADNAWLTQVGSHTKIDVLLAHCWMDPMKEIVEGVNPKTVVLGHENEMEHTIDHREAYWLTFNRMRNVKIPYVIMAWGEFLKL